MTEQDMHEGTYHFKYETEEAIQLSHVHGDEDGAKFWLPKSRIKYERRGRMVDVEVPYWLAEAKGLV